ncbi:heme-binding protein [uncultured Sphingomonas sp.]|uniref:GlcG/HbpS family heme-binding protein n=1 Tax=uncultured Sphingomonas sp. TaxID=158754 RepID=UPI00263741DF|nr:heme-binding protein [uncultured Sphingomonas sp.]
MNNMLKFAGATLLAVSALQPLAAAEPKQGPKPTSAPVQNLPVLSSAGVQAVMNAAITKAASNGWGSSIAVVDNAGKLLAFHRTDGAPMGTIDTALGKANTAIMFKAPTSMISQMVAQSAAMATIPGVVAVPGGYPIMYNGQVIGAIGVSGGMAGEDDIIAKAGMDALPGGAGAAK